VVVGTTETPVDEVSFEPHPRPEEIDFLLEHAARYLTKDPNPGDVLSAFAGIRPLASAPSDRDTASISRDHTVHISRSGLVTLTGGKWTTYRRMAEDAIERAALVGGLDEKPSVTASLRIHHSAATPGESDARIHPRLEITTGEVIRAARNEMARTVEDVLSRRSRALLLDARAALEAAPAVARVLGDVLGRSDEWRESQIRDFETIARGYLPAGEI
jgi:glycerol-3-phosphate dehydrogenase